jgi:hypothetical protein
MITLRDHRTADLFDPREHLGEKRRRLLERSWAGVFRKHLLKHLPVGELIARFSRQLGRPTMDRNTGIGALILLQFHDLTDAATVEAVAFNITWHYALDLRAESDAYLCERTLRNYPPAPGAAEAADFQHRVVMFVLLDPDAGEAGADVLRQMLGEHHGTNSVMVVGWGGGGTRRPGAGHWPCLRSWQVVVGW